ncbi:MAG: 4Fe-4S binding protein [Burkholderiaceae bacterium]|nr:4Fe-4S binding protein [Sulfuritalea sp.]MCF8175811.1 4Fe-4S binding protein [Burkholderiaceae bacterium]MCF8184822.1 4Fe-4S binding protein [Polynucleobacter sp.]
MQTATITLHPRLPQRRTRLAQLGDWMATHRRAILAVQWVIVVFYLLLVALPAFLPHPLPGSRLLSSDFGAASFVDPNRHAGSGEPVLHEKTSVVIPWHDKLVLFAQFAFWGVWWPFAILSIMLMGRVWCGVLCPEGALTEFASRHGRGGRIPRWVRWSGWPLVAFALTTIYGQLISVYEYPKAVLLILGGSTVAAAAIGWMYGKGKRVWCRYLCPVSGVFALLARLAPFQFQVDRKVWESHPARHDAVDCAPLLDVKHLPGMSQCHACGRCSDHRGAVTLTPRSPNAEILSGPPPATNEILLLSFGILGVAIGAFQWSVNPWFVWGKQTAAEWLLNHEMYWMLDESPAWWLLTRYPEANDVFTWLDGFAILAYIGSVALVIGGTALLAVRTSARLAGVNWQRLGLGLVPLGGISLFLGLSMLTLGQLRTEAITLPGLDILRGALLALGLLWSAWLGLRLLRNAAPGSAGNARLIAAFMVWLVPLVAVGSSWILVFYVW